MQWLDHGHGERDEGEVNDRIRRFKAHEDVGKGHAVAVGPELPELVQRSTLERLHHEQSHVDEALGESNGPDPAAVAPVDAEDAVVQGADAPLGETLVEHRDHVGDEDQLGGGGSKTCYYTRPLCLGGA